MISWRRTLARLHWRLAMLAVVSQGSEGRRTPCARVSRRPSPRNAEHVQNTFEPRSGRFGQWSRATKGWQERREEGKGASPGAVGRGRRAQAVAAARRLPGAASPPPPTALWRRPHPHPQHCSCLTAPPLPSSQGPDAAVECPAGLTSSSRGLRARALRGSAQGCGRWRVSSHRRPS